MSVRQHETPDLKAVWERNVEAQKKIRYLSNLPHWTVTSTGAVVDIAPGVLNPGFTRGNLQVCLDKAIKGLKLRDQKVALVDLTKGFGQPEFAGNKSNSTDSAASIGKLAVLYGAFQLRFDLEQIAKKQGATDRDELFAKARELWIGTQNEANRRLVLVKNRKVPMRTMTGTRKLPFLENVFDYDASTKKPSFKRTNDSFARLKEIDNLHHEHPTHGKKIIDLMGFGERMQLAIGFSNNWAAAKCIREVGYLYISSLLLQSGIYDQAGGGGGLWLHSDYGGSSWESPFAARKQNATCASLARFMTLLMQNRLVSPTASQEMQALMDKDKEPGKATRSPFEQALECPDDDPFCERSGGWSGKIKALSKLGLLTNWVGDCAYIEHSEGSRILRYVVVMLGARSDMPIRKLLRALDKCIADNQ